MKHSTLVNLESATQGRRHQGQPRVIAGLFFSLVVGGCGTNDAAAPDDPSVESGPIPSAQHDAEGSELIVTSATSTAVSGTLRNATDSVEFYVEALDDGRGTFAVSAAGQLLFRAFLGPESERLEFGSTLVMEGEAGELIRQGGPRWDVIHVDGDLSEAARIPQLPEFALVLEVPRALANTIPTKKFEPGLIRLLSLAAGIDSEVEGGDRLDTLHALQPQGFGSSPDTAVGDGLVLKSACSDGCEAKAWGCYLSCSLLPFGLFWCYTPCQNGYWQCAYACGG